MVNGQINITSCQQQLNSCMIEQKEDLQSLHRSLRFVEQICYLLKLSRPCTKTAMDYFYQLSSNSPNKFQIQIMMGTSIFLSSKIFQTQRKIRDILNMIFAVTALHRIIQTEQQYQEQGKALKMKDLMKREGLTEAIIPTYSLNSYNQYKATILQAEQHLLRVLGFNFNQAEKNINELKTIMVLIHQLRLPQLTAQTILNTYNDLPFTQLEKWIGGILYFGYVVGRVATKDEEFQEEVIIRDQDWEILFCTSIEKLKNYSIKIAEYYETKNCKQQQDKLNHCEGPKREESDPQVQKQQAHKCEDQKDE